MQPTDDGHGDPNPNSNQNTQRYSGSLGSLVNLNREKAGYFVVVA